MKIGILQPGYLPWLGFFEQVYRTDLFVVYDDVQYDKHGWRNRNRIKTPNGAQWLTVPVHASLMEPPLVKDVRIDNRENWRKKHLASIRQNYSKAAFFSDYIGIFEEAYSKEWEHLAELDIHFILKICEALGMPGKRFVRSSTLDVRGARVERLIEVCKSLGADAFYEGAAGKSYIDPADFRARGIEVEFQDYRHPVYRQLYGEFLPWMSVIDLMFNNGKESLSVIINEKS